MQWKKPETKPKTIVLIRKTGRQYENTCDLCANLSKIYDIDNNLVVKCALYPAMDNNVRCIYYDDKH